MKSNYFISDLKAGLVVFLVALPLCLGIALAQNVPLFSGIIAGVVGGIVVASISGSKLSVSGPAAGLTSIVLSSVSQLGSFETFLLALSIAGVIQIILGVIKAGIIGHYFPAAVIKGMLAAIGIILFLKQIPHFFGYDKDAEGDESFIQTDGQNSFSELANMIDSISPGSMIIGCVSVVILLLWQNKKMKKSKLVLYLPAALLVVMMGIALNAVFNVFFPALIVKPEHLVVLPEFNSMPDLFNAFTHPNFAAITDSKVYEVAFVIAAVASLESLLSIEAVDKLDPNSNISPTNRELIAQGSGNLISGLIGGIPITSVIVRSSVNVHAGGKSQLSSIIHGLLFLVALFIIPNILQLIPLSALAAILIVTGLNLSKPVLYKVIYKQGWDQFLPFIITIVVMLLTDLMKGVSVGICVAIVFILKQNYKSPFKLIQEEINGQMNVFIKLSQNVTFINKGKFIDVFKAIPVNSVVYIDGGRSVFIDKDVLEIISTFKKAAPIKKIKVHLEAIPEVDIFSNH